MSVQEVGKVFSTTDYDYFRGIEENRIVTEGRVKKLMASFGEKDIFNPIIINEKHEVIDGQGRFEARKAMGLPIYFIVVPGLTAKDCAILNLYNTKWTAVDWLNSWSKNKDNRISQNYKTFLHCLSVTKLSLGTALRLAGKSRYGEVGGGERVDSIATGKLSFSVNDHNRVVEKCTMGNQILEHLCFTARASEAFWSAVAVITDFDGYSHTRMLKNCEKMRSSYNQMANTGSQLKEFSRIYNVGYGTKNRLYFEDYMRNKGHNVRSYDVDGIAAEALDRDNISSLIVGG